MFCRLPSGPLWAGCGTYSALGQRVGESAERSGSVRERVWLIPKGLGSHASSGAHALGVESIVPVAVEELFQVVSGLV